MSRVRFLTAVFQMPSVKKTSTDQVSSPRLPFRGKRPFYGWIMVGVGAVTQFFQGITSQGFSTYLPFLQAEFHWTKAALAVPRSIAQIENSILGPIEGYLMDRFGPRLMATFGVAVLGFGLILFGLTHDMFMYYMSNILIDIGTAFQGMLVLSVTINNWFRRKRTIAQAIMLLGFSMAGVIGVPLIAATQDGFGWRAASIGSGIIIWVVGLPVTMLLRTRPEPYGLLPDGDPPDAVVTPVKAGRQVHSEYDFSLREAVRTRAFWLLAVGWAIGNLGMGAAQMHVFLHLENVEGGVGLTHAAAAIVWSVASLTNIPFRLIGGLLGDRLPKNVLLAVSSMLMASSILVLAVAESAPMAFVYAVLYGIGWGIRTPVMNAIQADYFGRKSLGKIVGWLQSISLPVMIAAPIVVGYIADIQETYRTAFAIVAFISIPGSAVLFFVKAPKPPSIAKSSPYKG
jgi:MFS family permease